MKTLVTAAHTHGPAINSHGGCYARSGNNGMCPGVTTAEWLNSLGDDNARYASVTAGQVRDNWLRSSGHIVAKDPALAKLLGEQRGLEHQLRQVQRRINEIVA